jgi:hypothetical protein
VHVLEYIYTRLSNLCESLVDLTTIHQPALKKKLMNSFQTQQKSWLANIA